MKIIIYTRFSGQYSDAHKELLIYQKYRSDHQAYDMYKFFQRAQKRWSELKALRLITIQSIKRREFDLEALSELRLHRFSGLFWPLFDSN